MDALVARAVAAHGCVRRGVIEAYGVPGHVIADRLVSGEWRHVIGDVVHLGATPPTVAARMAAVGLLMPEHRFSGEVALAAWGLISVAEVRTVVAEVSRNHAPVKGEGVFIRRSSAAVADVLASPVVRGIRVISEADAVRERVADLTPARADEIVEAYLRRHAEGAQALRRVSGRGRAGSAKLGAALARVDDGHWSKPERDLAARLRRAGIVLVANAPFVRPSTGQVIYIDLFDPERRRGIEVDGWSYHVGRARFAGDRRRDRWLLNECGIEILRVAASEVLDDLDQVTRDVLVWLRRPAAA